MASDAPQFRRSPHSIGNKLRRQAWWLVYSLFFRFSPRLMYGWRSFLLRCFGATVGSNCKIYPSVTVWAPWNLTVGRRVAIGERVDLYSVDRIHIGDYSTISQGVVLCTASHDISKLHLPLITGSVSVGSYAWVCAESFVMPEVKIGKGAVIGARSTVLKNVSPWKVAAGSPCKILHERQISKDQLMEIGGELNDG